MNNWIDLTLGGKPCVTDTRKWPQAADATSFFLPLGAEPGAGYAVLRKQDADALFANVNATGTAGYVPLVMKTGPSPAQTLTLPKMYLDRAIRLEPGADNLPDAPLLVTFRDKRILAKLFSPPASLAVLRDAASPPADPTWAECAQSLWEEMSFLGAWPGLPYTPTSKAATLRWLGLPCWDALSILLDYICCAVAYNPLTDAFTIVKHGAAQSIPYSADDETYRTRTLNGVGTGIPEKVRIQFPGGTTTLNTSVTGAVTGSFKAFTDYYSPASGSDQTNRATELRDNWLADQQITPEKVVYRGLLSTVLAGGTVKGVCWRYNSPLPGQTDGGFRTELLSHPAECVRDSSHDMPQLWGTLDGALAQGGSATMSIFWREAGSWTDSGTNITVYDRLLKSGMADIDSGNWVQADWHGDRYWATSAECN